MRIFTRLSGLAAGLVLATALGAGPAVAHDDIADPAPDWDHLECWQVRDEPGDRFIAAVDTHVLNNLHLLPNNTVEKNCDFKSRAKFLCLDAQANYTPSAPGPGQTNYGTLAGGPGPNAWGYLCYKMSCDRNSTPDNAVQNITVHDEFGPHNLIVKKIKQWCVPLRGYAPIFPWP